MRHAMGTRGNGAIGRAATAFALGAIVVAMAVLGGCASLKVTPISNTEVGGLTADDVVMLMTRAGFTEKEILEQGAALRNALAIEGAARINNGTQTEAVFAVHYPFIHVSSLRRGSFIYNIGDASRNLQ